MIQINELELEPRELNIDELRKVTGGAISASSAAPSSAALAEVSALSTDMSLFQQELSKQALIQDLFAGAAMNAKSASDARSA